MGPFLRFAARSKLTLVLVIKGITLPIYLLPCTPFLHLEPFLVSSSGALYLGEADRSGYQDHGAPHLYKYRPFFNRQAPPYDYFRKEAATWRLAQITGPP